MRLEEVEEIREIIRSDVTARRARALTAEAADNEPRLRASVGIALTDTDDVYNIAVRVPDAEALERFKARYATLFEQYKDSIDVKFIGRPDRASAASESSSAPKRKGAAPIKIGMSVRHKDGPRGTLGFFAYLGKTLGFVSCNHVIGLTDAAKAGDDILDANDNVVGSFVMKHRLHGFETAIADCAFAELSSRRAEPKTLGRVAGGTLARRTPPLRKQMPVAKIGGATGTSRGTVTAFGLSNFEVDYDDFFSSFDNIIEMESTERDESGNLISLGDDGDSGALVYTKDTRQPLGMIFFKAPGGAGNTGLLYASPFELVTRALGVELAI